jgi:hypothetical protein
MLSPDRGAPHGTWALTAPDTPRKGGREAPMVAEAVRFCEVVARLCRTEAGSFDVSSCKEALMCEVWPGGIVTGPIEPVTN